MGCRRFRARLEESRNFDDKFRSRKFPEHYFRNFQLQNIEDFPRLLLEQPDLRGLNVTFPYKELIIPFLDDIDDEAKKIKRQSIMS